MLDVFPDVFAYGILLVPKGIKPGERRPVVVCQHGLEGRLRSWPIRGVDNPAYHRYACQLAEQGFITYAPQNPYIGEDRISARSSPKANPLKKSLFSFIVPQHEATVKWLAKSIDGRSRADRFYGLSYGGKTAMRVPAIVQALLPFDLLGRLQRVDWKNASRPQPL